MKKLITILSIILISTSCTKEEDQIINQVKKVTTDNKVLVLKVDFATNTFDAGKELVFDNQTETFTTNVVVQSNDADGGNIKVFYQELNQKLFEGTQSWTGQIVFPIDFLPATTFESALTADYFLPPNFLNIYNPDNEIFNFESAWIAIQSRIKVRNYMLSNPNQIAKIFLFTEYSSGIVGPKKKLIIILKK